MEFGKEYINPVFGGPCIDGIHEGDKLVYLIYRLGVKKWVVQFNSYLFISQNIVQQVLDKVKELNKE